MEQERQRTLLWTPSHVEGSGLYQLWGEWCILEGKGNFNPDQHPMLKATGITKWEEWCYQLGKEIFNENHPVLLKATGVTTNWGEWGCYLFGKGIFNENHVLKAAGVTSYQLGRDGEWVVERQKPASKFWGPPWFKVQALILPLPPLWIP